jgi:UDP-glucose 4-epimerase
MSSPSTILVTGGAGYIGSHTVLALVRAGRPVLVLDDLSTGHRQAVPDGAALVVGSLADRQLLSDLFARHRFGSILHFAARSIVGDSMRDPVTYLRDNAVEFLNLIEVAVAHGAPPIVLSSTAALFGRPDRDPIDEECRIEPGNPYGESKLYAERALSWAGQAYGLRSIALRYFNAAGADDSGMIGEDHRPETHLIPRLLSVALGRAERATIFGTDYPTPDGTCIRDYVHVSDLATAHLLSLDALLTGASSDVFNLGSGLGFSVAQVLDSVRRVTGHPIPADIAPRRVGDPARLVASSAKAERLLGWRRSFDDLDRIVASAWAWHSRHPDGFVE